MSAPLGSLVLWSLALHPSHLLGVVCHLFGCVEEEDPGGLSEEDFFIGLLDAPSNLIPGGKMRFSLLSTDNSPGPVLSGRTLQFSTDGWNVLPALFNQSRLTGE